jgi:hypothetical protein
MIVIHLVFLLQNSNGFAVKSRNGSTIGNLMDKICDIDVNNRTIDQCSRIYLKFAENIALNLNCKVDFQNENQLVKQTFVAFKNYQVMQIVGCSKNSTDIYCYQDALINRLGLGLFYLPLGNPFYSNDYSCSECNKKIMNTYADFSSDETSSLSTTFNPAKSFFNDKCGKDFVISKSSGSISNSNNLFNNNNNIYLWLLYLMAFYIVT